MSAVRTAINNLYGTSAGSGSVSKRSNNFHTELEREVADASTPDPSAPEEITDGMYRQYLANILSQKFALNGSYAIYVFMGDFDDSPTAWPLSPSLVGTHAVFAALLGADTASNPQAKQKQDGSSIQVTGTMPLTSMLLAKVQAGELQRMDPETVAPYLSDNLHWRVGMVSGTCAHALLKFRG